MQCNRSFRGAIGAFLACSLGAGTTLAQEVLFSVDGAATGDQSGFSVSGAGDANGDGVPDFLVGSPNADVLATDGGSVQVISGANGSLLYQIDGNGVSDQMGRAVAGAGDVNGDGYDDFVIGIALDDDNGTNSGSALVYSGQDGSLLYAFLGENPGDAFGSSVDGAGDVNGDNYDDVIVGAPGHDANGPQAGRAQVFSGLNGTVLYTWDGDGAQDSFGQRVSGAGDTDGDGFADLLVAAPFDDDRANNGGMTRLFSGQTGSVRFTLYSAGAGDNFGSDVDGAHDVNGDGFDDFLVGARYDDTAAFDAGAIVVYSGANAAILHQFQGLGPGDEFGQSAALIGDANGDNQAEILVGAHRNDINGSDTGAAYLFDGATGLLLYSFDGVGTQEEFGRSVCGVSDVDGDGFNDLIVGARLADTVNGTTSGRVTVYSGAELFLNATPRNAPVGTSLTLTTAVGVPFTPLLLLVAAVDGIPVQAQRSLLGFNALGLSQPMFVVPALFPLQGHLLTFRSFTLNASSKIIVTADESIFFP